jgi:hypothetical protein
MVYQFPPSSAHNPVCCYNDNEINKLDDQIYICEVTQADFMWAFHIIVRIAMLGLKHKISKNIFLSYFDLM